VLARKFRLTKEKDFERVFKKGRMFSGAFISVKVLANDTEILRFGFVVSLKVSKKAVERNKIRRRLQDLAMAELKMGKKGADIVITAKAAVKEKNFKEISAEFKALIGKAKI
jgi:ribonuclease P protein component